jgi:hypothetical protein
VRKKDRSSSVPDTINLLRDTDTLKLTRDNKEYDVTLLATKSALGSGSSSGVVYPTSFTHWHDESIIVSGNPIRNDTFSTIQYGIESYQDPAALNDSFKFYKLLEAGTYTFGLLTVNFTNLGKIQLDINGVLAFNDIDPYAASALLNVRYERTITITTSGLHEFKITIFDKNASSTGYSFSGRKFWAYKI